MIEFAYSMIQKHGPLRTSEIMDLSNRAGNIRWMANSSNQLSQKMRASPLFVSSADRVDGLSGPGKVKLWDVVSLETVARDYIALKARTFHTVRKRRNLPRFLRDEIRRIENENHDGN